MKITISNAARAVPLFGNNAPHIHGALMVTSRSDSDTAFVALLDSVPAGTVNADLSVEDPVDAEELALVATTLPNEAGFIFDGVSLDDARYLYVRTSGTATIDVSFVPNRVPVDIGAPGGRL